MTAYLDCNATAPLEPAVSELVARHFRDEVGNAGSRTHEFGQRAKKAVLRAREQVASLVGASSDEVIFTSGATESNNIALLGLCDHGLETGRQHIVSTEIEHKAVLEPLCSLQARGFEVTFVPTDQGCTVSPQRIREAVRPDTLAVSVMHVNNETGVEQPLDEISEQLSDSDAYLHVDAAQGYGKSILPLRNSRVDLISVSSHKIYGPVGVGALIARKRGYERPPLRPLVLGGGQERGLRAGTLAVPLITGLGLASELASSNHRERRERCKAIRKKALDALESLGINLHGDQSRVLPHVVNFSVPDLDSEAVMLALKGVAAISNGSACTSESYKPSHVLSAMGLEPEQIAGALRISWSHLTPDVDWSVVAGCIKRVL